MHFYKQINCLYSTGDGGSLHDFVPQQQSHGRHDVIFWRIYASRKLMVRHHLLKNRQERPAASGLLPASTWHLPQAVALLLLLLGAFFLRIYLVANQSIWFDEAITLNLATSSFAEIVADRAANIHPPLYFFLMKGWVTLVGVNPFVVRYTSVLASFLEVSALFLAGRSLLNRRVAWLAALLVAFSPLSIIYAQELRVYALLPLAYLALLVLGYALSRPQTESRRGWLLLALVELVALHLHYIAILGVAYVALLLLWRLWRRQDFPGLRRWFLAQLAVGLASLPWAILVLATWRASWREANLGSALSEPVPRLYLIRQVWTFLLTGLTGILEHAPVLFLSTTIALLIAILFLWRFRQRERRKSLLSFSVHWFLPLLVAFSLWSIRSFSHPRYIIIFSGAFFLWLAYLLVPDRGVRPWADRLLPLLRVSLFGALLALAALTLNWYYFHPRIGKKDDTRAVARYLESMAQPRDLILMPYRDRSLLFEYQGETPTRMPDLEDRDQMWRDLQAWTTPPRTVHLVTLEKGSLDWQNILPFALEAAGTLVDAQSFDGVLLHSYRLNEPVSRPLPAAMRVEMEGLRLTGAWIEPAVPTGTAVPVALQWHPSAGAGAPRGRYGISLALRDADGWPVVQSDQLLLDAAGQPAMLWTREAVTTYHLLPLPAGTPPLSYTLEATVYTPADEGVESVMVDEPVVTLGTTQLVRADVAGDLYQDGGPVSPLPKPLPFTPGLALLGAQVDRDVVAPGEQVNVSLRWQATTADLPALQPQVTLVQAETRLGEPASAPVLDRYPTTRWRKGEVVTEHRTLQVPPGASGTASVLLSLGEHTLPLAEVEISSVAHQFKQPAVGRVTDVQFGGVARLAGYDLLGPAVTAGQPFTVTLYWQSLVTGTDRPYTVFVHLVADDGRLIGQHDAPPAQGQRPLTGWVDGEFIVDSHPVTFHEADYGGPARLAVGLYDPESGERLQTPAGTDIFYLPDTLEIIPHSKRG